MALSLLPRSKSRPIVGLDIEPGRAVAAQVSLNGTVRLTRAVSVALPLGVVRDGEVIDVEAVSAALRQLWSENKGSGATCASASRTRRSSCAPSTSRR